MLGADPYICNSKGENPGMVTKNIFLKIYLKQVEKAHSIMNFLNTTKTKKNILKKIRALESLKSKNTASE